MVRCGANVQGMTLAPLAPEERPNPAIVYIGGLQSPRSREAVRGRLNRVARFFRAGTTAATFPWHELQYEDMQRLRGHLAESCAHTTTNYILTSVRKTMRAAWRLGLINGDHFERVTDVERVRGESLPAGRALSLDEVRALIDAAKSDSSRWRGKRDAALVVLLYCAGIRRAEVAGLEVEDLVEENGRVYLNVLGKGNKRRRVPLPREAKPIVDEWLDVRGRKPGPLFPARSRRGQDVRGRPMRGSSVGKLVVKLVKRAGIEHVTPHFFRYTYISNLLDESGDVSAIQKLAGHANVTTTLRYDRRGERAKEAAVDRLPLPFGGG